MLVGNQVLAVHRAADELVVFDLLTFTWETVTYNEEGRARFKIAPQ